MKIVLDEPENVLWKICWRSNFHPTWFFLFLLFLRSVKPIQNGIFVMLGEMLNRFNKALKSTSLVIQNLKLSNFIKVLDLFSQRNNRKPVSIDIIAWYGKDGSKSISYQVVQFDNDYSGQSTKRKSRTMLKHTLNLWFPWIVNNFNIAAHFIRRKSYWIKIFQITWKKGVNRK